MFTTVFMATTSVVLDKERHIDSCFVSERFSCCTTVGEHHDVHDGRPAWLHFRKAFLFLFLQEFFIITGSREEAMGKVLLIINGKEVEGRGAASSKAKVRLCKHKPVFSAILLFIFY